ncbi:hypothetical protein AB6N24_17875 [Cellulomonas sp. 179-A 4D5 NHS]|uniref:hypothetical protein n=1 Tax=Cellulomonas sp. 179-A 4D5 NHS TaxID=3142378 RepID=UPI00399F253D
MITVTPATASPKAATTAPTTCEQFAATEPAGDWACFNGTVTRYEVAGDRLEVSDVDELAAAPSSSRLGSSGDASTQAIASEYLSNVTEPIFASIAGTSYNVPVTVRTSLYNHSADVKMSYTSSPAVSLIWSLRIRRDNRPLQADDTVFSYPFAFGSSYASSNFSVTEGRYGDGYNQLPYDGKRYFFDLYSLRMSASGRVINIAGTVQSDRMTCYKTVSCKFN